MLLQAWFPSASTPGAFLISDFLALTDVPLPDTHRSDLTDRRRASPRYFAAYAALAKVALLITTLKLSSDDVTLVAHRAASPRAGWTRPRFRPAPSRAADRPLLPPWTAASPATAVRARSPIANATFTSLFGAASVSARADT